MAAKLQAQPGDFHTITPGLMVRGAAEAIEFYKKAFGARERMRMLSPDGKSIMHAELEIGDSCFFLGDECPEGGCKAPASLGGCTATMHVYFSDVDAAFQQAVSAGAKPVMPVADMFWGDRYGMVVDPYGHHWGLATHVEDLSPEEMCQRAKEFFETAAAAKG